MGAFILLVQAEILAAAARCASGDREPGYHEVTEETGIPAEALRLLNGVPIDIDVHPIPANPAKGEPEHQHFDLRYAFTTTTRDVTLQAEEVHDFAWLPAVELEPAWLAQRIATVVAART